MGIKEELGQKIKILRKKRKLTQEQLSEFVDITPRALVGIELGEYYPKAETLDKIIEALGTTTEELFSNEYIPSQEKMYNYILDKLPEIKENKQKLQILYKVVKGLYIS